MYVDDATRIGHMLEASRDILHYGGSASREDLDENILLATSLAHWIQVVGEAARLVSADLNARHPEVPWSQIQGTRHRIVHDYTEIELDIVWDVVSTGIPELVPQLESILSEIEVTG
jgi:uncharacterized protein with HEPN domain